MKRILLLIAFLPSTHAFMVDTTRIGGIRRTTQPIRSTNTRLQAVEEASICVIGGGVSGLAAALTAAEKCTPESKVVLLEASPTCGGRVQSDVTDDGYILDRGFAVFIEEYPYAKQLLDYDSLNLGPFLPGALVKLKDSNVLARVSDPLRVPTDLVVALFANVGTLEDKIRVLPLIYNVRTKSIEELFEEPETDTLTALKERWGFSDDMISKFFSPFLEGIYLAPLEEQSSRMFSFVFKMFSEGAATLPAGGMGAVAQQLVDKAQAAGVDIRVENAVQKIVSKKDGSYDLVLKKKGKLNAEKVIVATEGPVTQTLLATVNELKSLAEKEGETQRSVGCLYYSFDGQVPVTDPILILNGIGAERGNDANPVNNCCFPSVVRDGYSPAGSNLCSVTILKDAMESFADRQDDLDSTVRRQLSTWFPDQKDDILNKWKLERVYSIPNAQPAQLGGPMPANVNGGRPCDTYRDVKLPAGLFVAGDAMATATLNGALESGVNAGNAATNAT
jgi:phytoene dehydrogenase-like protein